MDANDRMNRKGFPKRKFLALPDIEARYRASITRDSPIPTTRNPRNKAMAAIAIISTIVLIIAPSCSLSTDGNGSISEAATESNVLKIHDKMKQEQTATQENSVKRDSSSNSYMLSVTGTISSISDDSATISTDSENVDVNLSNLKDGFSYPAYITPGIEIVASYFPEDRDSEGRLIIRQIMLKSQYDEIARRNGR